MARHLKTSLALLLLPVHICLCQQPSSYSAQSQTKLEDIERDNLKNVQSATASPQLQNQVPTQYLQYPTQDQSYYNLLAAQQSIPIVASGHQAASAGVGQQIISNPNQQSAALFAQQQQPIFYYSPSQQPSQQQQQQQQQPAFDFSSLSLYPYVLPQANLLSADYYKSLQATAGQTKTPAAAIASATPSAVPASIGAAASLPTQAYKNIPPYHFGHNYFIPAASPSPFYQPVSFQPQNTPANQYYYNSLYQLQSPHKSIYPAGVKSTTTPSPTKAKDEQHFVPIGASNYRLEYSTADPFNNYGKVRLSG